MNRQLSKYFFYYPITYLHGENINKYLEFSRQFQWWDITRIEEYQSEKLLKLLQFSVSNSDYYHEIYANSELDGIQSPADLINLPLVEKSSVIDHSHSILTRKSLLDSKKTTGGSTGKAVTLIKNPSALARERAVTARSYEWANVFIGDKQIRFWGTPLTKMNSLRYKAIDLVANRKRISAFAISDEHLSTYTTTINKFQPAYIYGYVSAINELANYYRQYNLILPRSVKSIITTSEVLSNGLRQNIQNSFKVKVYNEYGCGEVGSIAHECEFGSMHLMADNLIIECVDDKGNPSNEGELVVTDLYNYTMPLIRYRLGDYATISYKNCECGRKLPIIKSMHGRAYDMFLLQNGKKVHPEAAMYIFEEIKDKFNSIEQFQVIQKTYTSFLVRVVKSNNYNAYVEEYIRNRFLEKICSNAMIEFEYTDKIEREASGKLRLIKSNLKT